MIPFSIFGLHTRPGLQLKSCESLSWSVSFTVPVYLRIHSNWQRGLGLSVSLYVATFKHLVTECKFGEAMRTKRLRERLVSGIRDSKMIIELLKVKLADLSFDLAVQKCLAIEQASKDVQVLQRERGPGAVNKLRDQVQAINLTLANLGRTKLRPKSPQKTQGSRGKGNKQLKPCYCCTGSHHSQKCPFIKERCYHCGIMGHTASMLEEASHSANKWPWG